ncbi:hypothetical protein ACIBSV_47120 [Embleya sp. NPDC050154]|uniref:hypothetical protein n=1 Tax=Embleya sp. NPDC050154 TaxID=3363988 RepID=UPI00379CFE45
MRGSIREWEDLNNGCHIRYGTGTWWALDLYSAGEHFTLSGRDGWHVLQGNTPPLWVGDALADAKAAAEALIVFGESAICENCGRAAALHPHVPGMQVCDACDPDDAANRPEPPA